MTRSRPARITTRLAVLVVVVAAITAALGDDLPASPTWTVAPPAETPRKKPRQALEPALVDALIQAEADAGIDFVIESGWRSAEHQQQLLDEAVEKYGSREEAARWVATPETSPHVSGDAVDLETGAATAWLSEYGAAYGLCQIYANEPWHYELRPDAIDQGCPAMYADPTEDPRMQS